MHKNLLADEKSPYLLQHKDNPVWWFPWGDEAFAAAKKENKIIFLSIGYSTCHWCHVMEKDSFEKNDIADRLNQNYISIKVDREERPDVDAVYMNAVQAMTGSGGWPMSVMLTPDGKPFWGGTFVAHASFQDLLEKVTAAWQSTPEEIQKGAHQLGGFLIEQCDLPETQLATTAEVALDHFVESFAHRFDPVNGGTKGAPKFPSALALSALLRIYQKNKTPEILVMVEKTLGAMRRGGIYDQIGGGFHRYATDDHWLIPHFEKMLYDNALLTTSYLEAFQVTHNPEYAQTARETLDYVLREMTSPEGGFYSAEDADSEHIEGKYYVWSDEELERTLTPEEKGQIVKTFSVSGQRNFHAHKTGDEVTDKRFTEPALYGHVFFLAPEAPLPDFNEGLFSHAQKKLLSLRERRVHPHLDDKILTSWNGLMISSLARGAQVLQDPRYLAAAQKAAHFILEKLRDKNGALLRRYRDGHSGMPALSEDYAFFIEALLQLYTTDFDERWFQRAQELQRILDTHFWDETRGAYFENDGSDPHLPVRHKNFEDGVVPSANSVSAANLSHFFALTGELIYQTKTQRLLSAASALLNRYPQAGAKLIQVLGGVGQTRELAIFGPKPEAFIKRFHQEFFPYCTLAYSSGKSGLPLFKDREALNGLTTFYLCENQSCLVPETDETKAFKLLRTPKPI